MRGQEAPPKPADEEQARPTGLPSPVSWTFNFEAGWATFGLANPTGRKNLSHGTVYLGQLLTRDRQGADDTGD